MHNSREVVSNLFKGTGYEIKTQLRLALLCELQDFVENTKRKYKVGRVG